MLGFGESFLAWFASTAVPAFVGLLIITGVGRFARPKYLVSYALGVFLWFFVDTIGGSGNLDVNAGFAGGLDQIAIVALFVVGLLFFVSVDRSVLSGDSGTRSAGLAVPIAVAIALGMHGFGEGTAFGATAATTPSTSLLDAFGGLTAGVAYVLHKVLEPVMVGACYMVYSGERAGTKKVWLRDILALAAVFVIPSLVGATTGYFINYDASYFFALGTGTSIYAAMRLVRPLFQNTESPSSESIKLALLLVAGFLSIYVAALFHS